MVSWVFIRNKSATEVVSDKVHFEMMVSNTYIHTCIHFQRFFYYLAQTDYTGIFIYRTLARSSKTFNLKQYPNAIRTTFFKKKIERETKKELQQNRKKKSHTHTQVLSKCN